MTLKLDSSVHVYNDRGFRWLNLAKYHLGRFEALQPAKAWTHNEFSFLLDYVPNWKWSYGRRPGHGLIQFQPFVSNAEANDVFTEILRRNQRAGCVPYLGVFKRHRPDPFWLTHALDGWSFAMGYKVTPTSRAGLWKHCRDLTELVLDAGGKFYFAKDLVLDDGVAERMFPPEKLAAFLTLKRALDPEALLQQTSGDGYSAVSQGIPNRPHSEERTLEPVNHRALGSTT